MNDHPNPEFDAVHPSRTILARSCRGGALHSIALSENVMETDADSLAEGILRTASVSHLRAIMETRGEIIDGGQVPTSDVPAPQDLDEAMIALRAHQLPDRDD
jgi:hypothetical protein